MKVYPPGTRTASEGMGPVGLMRRVFARACSTAKSRGAAVKGAVVRDGGTAAERRIWGSILVDVRVLGWRLACGGW